MRLTGTAVLILSLLNFSCGSGGPLTPVQSFNAIRSAVEKNDSEAIVVNLSISSIEKISRLNHLIKDLKKEQVVMLSAEYGYPEEKIRNLKVSDAAALYFFSDVTGVKLGKYFKEKIVSVDIVGDKAVIKTESGIELDFRREGPYWKFDLGGL